MNPATLVHLYPKVAAKVGEKKERGDCKVTRIISSVSELRPNNKDNIREDG